MPNFRGALVLLPFLAASALTSPAKAGESGPTTVACWFFRGEAVELQQTCTDTASWWMGGGVGSLKWEDGVVTHRAWGLQGRGERPCENMSLDNVCAIEYGRNFTTLERISEDEVSNYQRDGQPYVRCLQVGNNSVCWEKR
jgi:hypothetical protein